MTRLYDSTTDFYFLYITIKLSILLNVKDTNPCLLMLSGKINHQNMYEVFFFFEKDIVELMNIFCILRDPEIVKSLRTTSSRFHMPMVSSID